VDNQVAGTWTRTVLVTGADGQLGCRLVRRLLHAGYRVRGTILPAALDPRRMKGGPRMTGLRTRARGSWASLSRVLRGRRPRRLEHGQDPLAGLDVELVTGDLRDPRFAAEALRGVDAVLHTANFVRADAFENNVVATLNVVRECARRAAEIRRLVYVSSSSVYPNDPHVLACEYHPVDERHPVRPVGAYSQSKLVGEKIVWAFARETGLPAAVVRPALMVSGEAVLKLWSVETVCGILRQGASHPESELHAGADESRRELTRRARSGEQPCAITDQEGQPWICQLVDTRDVAAGIAQALESESAVGGTFNISGPRPVPYPEAAAIVAELTGATVLHFRAPVRWLYDLDNAKARTMLGYAPAWDIREMIEGALAFRSGHVDGLT
jgi:nucleoside-diphosphate-sugar epimerase